VERAPGPRVANTTTAQHKIGSGFGADTTAAEVLSGIDLSGKLAILTGAYSGVGLETTRALAAAGAHVVVPARRPDTAKAALDGIAEVDELDLADLESVRGFAERFLASGRRIDIVIDIVIDSPATMAAPETRVGPGWELQFATNHLGHFALVNHLWPALALDARVVSVSSRGQLGQTAGVGAFAVHPGSIFTPLPRSGRRRRRSWPGVRDYATDPEQAARLWALSAELTGVNAFG
jgi:nucleoside-diphosphate-sugar epimerase